MTRDVTEVRPLDGYRLLLTFEGGDSREVDVSSIVTFDGVFKPLQDKSYFRQVRVEPEIGTIVWPNGADLCPDVLFESGTTTSNKVA
ncbi:molybdopterin-guanine dinucleotide biosynthesis protein A [cyanobacterium TDX16]|nr:molybdopterin-guanine dinucleotide biosynthesis protein A [cyanobacterium TDX16]